MRLRIFVAALILVAANCEGEWSADASPQPTTSPTNSEKTGVKPVKNTELDQSVTGRAAISANIV